MLVPVRLARTARGLESSGRMAWLMSCGRLNFVPARAATCRERAKGDSAGGLAGEFPTLPIVGAAGTIVA
ncbi:MAG: hypothetical protein R3B96_05670 [Pirellulaceae bacterium]